MNTTISDKEYDAAIAAANKAATDLMCTSTSLSSRLSTRARSTTP